ncbi:MAG: hypothetical protein KKH61_21360 [Gammaproteobacteria bacterium]|uniref:Uncharacterized protein n=1 Tax=viral metagenome TaxID=1070528 RepID=A0A6H1ZBA7_9ZZZZ|nr:hypothetical protein [Gammaproteobacteria bacterium]
MVILLGGTMVRRKLEETTIADFGGGWNVADSDLNMSSRYQPVSENIIRGANGSFTPRWGTQLFCDMRVGSTAVLDLNPVAYSVTNTSAYITITKTAHGRADGDHLTITAASILTSTLGGIPATSLLGTFGIVVIDADNFKFAVDTAATSTTTGNLNLGDAVTFDDYILAGNILHMQYFNRHMVVFDDIGEIAKVDDETGVATRIWSANHADTLTSGLVPTRACIGWSSTTFKSSIIACNGADRDKPIQIDEDFAVEFLIDKATLSNAHVPCADIVLGMQGYVIFGRTANGGGTNTGDPFVSLSALNTDGTFSGEASPQDAMDKDLSMITDTVNPIVIGAAPFRDKLFVAFYDRGMIGTLGIYSSGGDHEPDFSDTISEHGTVSHRTLVPLGNDIFMCDYAGVPSVSISSQSTAFIPVRVSELIGPEIQRHLANLSEQTLKEKAFAVFNKSDRQYMLFLPKYDDATLSAASNPFLFNDALKENDQALMIIPNHKLFTRSYITIAGATSIGTLDAGDINGSRLVVDIVDKDTILVQLGDHPIADTPTYGGGTSVTAVPINDETICYAFEYNKELKIRRWTRLRDLNFSCGASTQRGRLYFAKDGRIFRYGNNDEPLYADEISNYDERTWINSHAYTAGTRVYDSSNLRTYVARIGHTSAAAGTFATERSTNLDLWEEYEGEPIVWELETPWSDLNKRGDNKLLKYVSHDTEGSGQFTFSVFTNQAYRDASSYALAPKREVQFTAGDAGGFGMTDPQSWSSGRRTREERLWPMPCKGKLLLLRYTGSTRAYTRIISTTLFYIPGSTR